MDPISIATSCASLIAAVTQTILFLRQVIDAPKEQELITTELSNLENVVRLLQDHTGESNGESPLIPPTIHAQILSIISSCKLLVDRIYHRVGELKRGGTIGKIKWVTVYKDEVADLRVSLEAHRGSLGLAVQLISIPAFKTIQSSTTAIHADVKVIQKDVEQIQVLQKEVMEMKELVAGLAARGMTRNGGDEMADNELEEETLPTERPVGAIMASTSGEEEFVGTGNHRLELVSRERAHLLARYLDDLASYTESVLGDTDLVSGMEDSEVGGGAHPVSQEKDTITWYGQVRLKPGQRSDDERGYFKTRGSLADAIYWGQWEPWFEAMEALEKRGHTGWVNCWRIDTRAGWWSQGSKGFTALHQAAWHGASQATVQRLLDFGAWRLSRTLQPSESSPARSTPFDVALNQGARHLLALLNPVIRRPLSNVAITNLQRNLHGLIKSIFTPQHFPQVHLECFVLPELEVLTEFETAGMWFPLEPELKDDRGGLGVEIRLDAHAEELEVKICLGDWGSDEYTVSKEGVHATGRGSESGKTSAALFAGDLHWY